MTSANDNRFDIYSPILAPVIATSSPSNVSTTTITLNASVTSNNNASSTDRGFNYGLTGSYGSVASTTGTFNVGSFSQNLSGLTCNTTYHYQVFAINVAGNATSSDLTFTTDVCPTAPTVATSSPTSIDTTSITLNASITSDGTASSTDRGFNYGTTSSYGSVASTTGIYGVGAFSQAITGLTCNTTYHYNVFAINLVGTATTSDSTFTTSACPVVATTSVSLSSGGSSQASLSYLERILAPGPATTAYLNSLRGQKKTSLPIPSPFARNLSLGSVSSDVKLLQQYLNSKGYVIASSGPGSPGSETSTFGRLTRQALVKFQNANNIYPSVGYLGPITRAFIANNP